MEFKFCIVGNILYGKEQEDPNLLFQDEDSPAQNGNGHVDHNVNINITENLPLRAPPPPSPGANKIPSSASGNGATNSAGGSASGAGFQHSIFTFKDPTLQGIIEKNPAYKSSSNFPVNFTIQSNDGKEEIHFRH